MQGFFLWVALDKGAAVHIGGYGHAQKLEYRWGKILDIWFNLQGRKPLHIEKSIVICVHSGEFAGAEQICF